MLDLNEYLEEKKTLVSYSVLYCCDKTLTKNLEMEKDFILECLGHNPSLWELKTGILRQELKQKPRRK